MYTQPKRIMYTQKRHNPLQQSATRCNTPQCIRCKLARSSARVDRAYCNTLQHSATRCNTLQHAAMHCNTLQHTPVVNWQAAAREPIAMEPRSTTYVCCSVLQRVAVCCSVLQCVAVCDLSQSRLSLNPLPTCVAASRSVLQCVAAC